MATNKRKDFDSIWNQYKRALKKAFPKLVFRGSTWNWHKVYPDENPHKNTRFLLIANAYKNTLKKNGYGNW